MVLHCAIHLSNDSLQPSSVTGLVDSVLGQCCAQKWEGPEFLQANRLSQGVVSQRLLARRSASRDCRVTNEADSRQSTADRGMVLSRDCTDLNYDPNTDRFPAQHVERSWNAETFPIHLEC